MGEVQFPIQRIGLLFCVDGIPAFAAGTLSLAKADGVHQLIVASWREMQVREHNVADVVAVKFAEGQNSKEVLRFCRKVRVE